MAKEEEEEGLSPSGDDEGPRVQSSGVLSNGVPPLGWSSAGNPAASSPPRATPVPKVLMALLAKTVSEA